MKGYWNKNNIMMSIFLVALSLMLFPRNTVAVYEFRAGVVMVEKSVLPFMMEMVGPAIDIAIEISEREYGIRFKKYLALHSDFCNAVFTTGAIADLKYKVSLNFVYG